MLNIQATVKVCRYDAIVPNLHTFLQVRAESDIFWLRSQGKEGLKMRMDDHVHCRGDEWAYKTTIAKTIRLAHEQGVDIIFDMPNVPRPVIDRNRVQERLTLVPKGEEGSYRLYVGVTGEEAQLEEALWCYRNISKTIGLKMFAGKSVGDLSVTDPNVQRWVYRFLASRGFRGVLALHCEEEREMHPELWDFTKPISHTWARPVIAEVTSVRNNISYAMEADYRGKIHICHASCSDTVNLVCEARQQGLLVSCGVTPAHVMWCDEMMNRPNGNFFKVNPPLRSREEMLGLRESLRRGDIDTIGTDHAPHAIWEKNSQEPPSGIPSLRVYNKFVTEFLPEQGLSQELINAMTYGNIVDIFGDKLAA